MADRGGGTIKLVQQLTIAAQVIFVHSHSAQIAQSPHTVVISGEFPVQVPVEQSDFNAVFFAEGEETKVQVWVGGHMVFLR